ncbi:MAG: amidohydrolase family protein [Bacteroidales bacterium]
MIIDGHSHACGQYLTAAGIIDALDKHGVDKVVLVPGELNSKSEYSLPNIASKFPAHNVVKVTNKLTKFIMRLTGKIKDIEAGNEFVYNLKTKTNNRVIQFIWITKRVGKVSDYLNEKYDEWGFHGVKMHQCWEQFSINSDYFKDVAKWVEEKNLPLFIHLYSDSDVLKLIEYKRKHPELKLIVAHLFGLELFIKEFQNDGNLYFDSSPLQLVSDCRLMKAIDYVGINKVLMGTDTPYGAKDNLWKSINRIIKLDLSKEDKALLLGLNMKRLLNL